MTSLTTVADAEAVAARAAELLGREIEAALAARDVAHVALAGGQTPRRTYELLALGRSAGVELWFGDERCVGAGDPDANYRMVAETLLPRVPDAVVHRVYGELGPEAAASEYAERLERHVPGQPPVFDVVLLGIGEDGHTASLFPGSPALDEAQLTVVGVHDAPKPPPERVSLTLGVLCAARLCVMLATGAGKAAAVAAVIAGPDPRVPASLLRRGRLALIVDDAASPAPS